MISTSRWTNQPRSIDGTDSPGLPRSSLPVWAVGSIDRILRIRGEIGCACGVCGLSSGSGSREMACIRLFARAGDARGSESSHRLSYAVHSIIYMLRVHEPRRPDGPDPNLPRTWPWEIAPGATDPGSPNSPSSVARVRTPKVAVQRRGHARSDAAAGGGRRLYRPSAGAGGGRRCVERNDLRRPGGWVAPPRSIQCGAGRRHRS